MRKTLLPGWVVALFAATTLLLIPWTIGLVIILPSRHISHHWDAAWGGFDAMMICALGLTAFFAWRRSTWVTMSATASATLLLTDAWFDTLTAGGPMQFRVALVSAVGIEVPMALLCLWVAIRTARRSSGRERTMDHQLVRVDALSSADDARSRPSLPGEPPLGTR